MYQLCVTLASAGKLCDPSRLPIGPTGTPWAYSHSRTACRLADTPTSSAAINPPPVAAPKRLPAAATRLYPSANAPLKSKPYHAACPRL